MSPKDRERYLESIADDDDGSMAMKYCIVVKGEGVTENIIRSIVKGSLFGQYLTAIVGLDEYAVDEFVSKLFLYFNHVEEGEQDREPLKPESELVEDFVDFLMGRNITPDLVKKTIVNNLHYSNFKDIPTLLLEYFSKNNIPKPKPLIKVLVISPIAAYNYFYRRNRLGKKVPNIIIDTIRKSPEIAYRYYKQIKGGYDDKEISDEKTKSAILKDPDQAYHLIQYFERSSFELYPDDYVAWLLSQKRNGFKFLEDHYGFGIYKTDERYKPIRRAIFKNIISDPEHVKYKLEYMDDHDIKANPVYYKLLQKARDELKKNRHIF